MRTIKLPGERISLSPVEADDAALWCRWLNDMDVALPLGDEAWTVLTPAAAQQRAERTAQSGEPVFTIVHNSTGEPIGRCLLFSVDAVNRTAMVGIFIGEKAYWNQGYGTEALTLLLDYGFNILNLHSVMLGVYSFNERAAACYRKVGFQEIGRRRQSRLIGGKWYDGILMDILAEEFSGRRFALEKIL